MRPTLALLTWVLLLDTTPLLDPWATEVIDPWEIEVIDKGPYPRRAAVDCRPNP